MALASIEGHDVGVFDPSEILSRTDGMIADVEARYLYDLAIKTHLSGHMVSIGIDPAASACCLAAAARSCGGRVTAIDPHTESENSLGSKSNEKDRALFSRTIRSLGLDEVIDFRKTSSQSAYSDSSGELDLVFIHADRNKEDVIQNIADWKGQVRVGGVMALLGANDGGEVDRGINQSLYRQDGFIEIRRMRNIRAFQRFSEQREMILCCGAQSGGTTIISWCFLQRPDMEGILDLAHFVERLPYLRTNRAWCKTAICFFRWYEVAGFYSDEGWDVKPLMIVRDVRSIYASLRKKPYGLNGTTCGDPPLRMRLRRYLRDWEEFRRNDWPIIRYESFVAEPEKTLRQCCEQLDLPWSNEMLTWPKGPQKITEFNYVQQTFRTSLADKGLSGSLIRQKAETDTTGIPLDDLNWLEQTFRDFNRANDYPLHVGASDPAPAPDRPTYHETTLSRYEQILDSWSWRITAPCRVSHYTVRNGLLFSE
ncbi:class I SAM-dependent methyltransferase [Thermodesulfobacteriota bacterium]